MRLPGRLLELRGDAHARGMTVHDRTRLNGRLLGRTIRRYGAECEANLAWVNHAQFVYDLCMATKTVSIETDAYAMSAKRREGRVA